jgi:UDP-N-acetylmuramoyl-L-alanyl-D-glutamate--2,6-diaminopimelate ligase
MLDLRELFPDQLTQSCFIDAVYADSNAVKPQSVFVALKGERTDGHKYVQKAFENGARVAIVEIEDPTIDGLQIVVPDTQRAVSQISAKLYPWEKPLRFVGVTGTDGKTSTSVFLTKLLTRLGHRVGYIGTNGITYAGIEKDFNGTTPLAVDLFPVLAEMSHAGVDIVVMEVSSHGLATQRVVDIMFDYAVFTNFSHDHLDYHKTLDAYKMEKLKLFKQLRGDGVAIVNLDDAVALDVIDAAGDTDVMTYGLRTGTADFLANNITYSAVGMSFIVHHGTRHVQVTTQLVGEFNVYNILAAIAISLDLGDNMSDIVANIKMIPPIEGRMELFYNEKRDFTAIVDFGHAPNAVKNVLIVARKMAQGRVIVVTGAVGDGDKDKRPLMADIAVTYADVVILTTDEPHSEEPEAIIDDMRAHLPTDAYRVIIARDAAIMSALDEAQAGDVVVVLGRGRRNEIPYKDKVIIFNDYEFIKTYMASEK